MALTMEDFLSSTSDVIDIDYLHDNIQFLIDENLRTIAIPSNGVVLGVIGDKNTNRVNFQMVRYYNGIDLSEYQCRVHYINANGDPNYYTVDDVTIEEDKLLFTWLVDLPATVKVGKVTFVVKMTKTEDETITNSFSTTIASANVLEGIDVFESISPEAIQDLIEHIKSEIGNDIEPNLTNFVKATGQTIISRNIDEVCSGSANNLENNKIYGFEIVDADDTILFSKCGFPCERGTILTYGPERTVNDIIPFGSVQLVVDYDGNVYTRTAWGVEWTEWKRLEPKESGNTTVRVEGTELILQS